MKHTLPKRCDVAAADKWHIEDYYENDSLWEEAYTMLMEEIPELAAYSGHLCESAATKIRNCP